MPPRDRFIVAFTLKQFISSNHLRIARVPDFVLAADRFFRQIGRVFVLRHNMIKLKGADVAAKCYSFWFDKVHVGHSRLHTAI
jgi:hypothetical protein